MRTIRYIRVNYLPLADSHMVIEKCVEVFERQDLADTFMDWVLGQTYAY